MHDGHMKPEVVTTQAPLGEGPVWCPDGTLVITQISPGGLSRIRPESGESERVVSVAGGANSAQWSMRTLGFGRYGLKTLTTWCVDRAATARSCRCGHVGSVDMG